MKEKRYDIWRYHMKHAEKMLEQNQQNKDRLQSLEERVGGAEYPNIIISKRGQILSANDAAHQMFGVVDGDSVEKLELISDEALSHQDIIDALRGSQTGFIGIVKLAMSSHEKGKSLKTQSIRMAATIKTQANGHLSLELRASETPWNEKTGRAFQKAFSINDGELKILRATMLGQTLQELADARGRSINTVRTQSKSLLKKLSINSKAELVRAYMSFKPEPRVIENIPALDIQKFISLADGRTLDVRQFGSPEGAPVLFFHGYVWGFRFPKRVIAEFEKRKKRLIVVCRPGYAGSTLVGARQNSPQHIAQDMLEVLDRLEIQRCPLLALGTGMLHACVLAQLAPDRISSLTSAGGYLPVHTRKAVKYMDKQYAAAWLGPRYFPSLTPYLARLLFASEDSKSPETVFAHSVRGSRSDSDLLTDSNMLEALILGRSDACQQGHYAIADDSIRLGRNWVQYVPEHNLAVGLVYGEEDRCTAKPIVKDFSNTHFPNAIHETISGAGRLVMFQSPDVVLDTLEKAEARSLH